MNANGRLTAPPLDEVALVTNSVCGKVLASRFSQLSTRGIALETSSLGLAAPPCAEPLARSRSSADLRFWTPLPAAATHHLSHPVEVAV
jgi:hypothetical protein